MCVCVRMCTCVCAVQKRISGPRRFSLGGREPLYGCWEKQMLLTTKPPLYSVSKSSLLLTGFVTVAKLTCLKQFLSLNRSHSFCHQCQYDRKCLYYYRTVMSRSESPVRNTSPCPSWTLPSHRQHMSNKSASPNKC